MQFLLSLIHILSVDAMDEAIKMGNSRVFNVIILGIAAKNMDFPKEQWIEVIKKTVQMCIRDRDYAELLHVRPIIEAINEENDLGYTYEQLNGMIDISTVEDTRILKISATSIKPEEAKTIANALAEKAVTEIPKLIDVYKRQQ